MMKVKIPYTLRMKLLNLEGLSSEIERHEINMNGIKRFVPGEIHHTIELDLADYPECLKACFDWYTIIETYFKTSYKAYRLDIGVYKGIWPISVNGNGTVKFRVDDVDLNKKDWKDWFVKEDIEYASIVTS